MMLSVFANNIEVFDLKTITTPCIGFELQYSPIDRDCVENISQFLLKENITFSFDIIQPLNIGQELVVLFPNQYNPTQHLSMYVEKCYKIENHYRVNLYSIEGKKPEDDDASRLISLPVVKDVGTPAEISTHCPACHHASDFHYVANQDGDWHTGIMPLYGCSSCGTTRTLIGLLGI